MIQTIQLRKEYQMGDTVVHALDGVDLQIDQGEFVSITGASGSGKSTLMHIFGCLDKPSSGQLLFRGEDVRRFTDKQLAEVRNQHIGFVFQTFNLIQRTSALDNVTVPLTYTRKPFTRATAHQALERVGLAARAKHKPSELSGGECQRVAIARAIVNKPSLILADEPTGNLDSTTGEQIMQVFRDLHADGITIILVTHELDVAVQAKRMIEMKDGKVVADTAVDQRKRNDILSLTHNARERLFHEKSAPGQPPVIKMTPETGSTG